MIGSINGHNLGAESIFCGINNFYWINYTDKSLGLIAFTQAIKRNILKVHNGIANGIYIANDTKTADSIGNHRSIKICNLRTGELVNTIRTKYHLTSINFTLDERFAIIFSKKFFFVVYDLKRMKDILDAKHEKKPLLVLKLLRVQIYA